MAAKEIVLASNNQGKVKEINALLREHGITVVTQSQYGIEDAVENGLTFLENALIKARHAAVKTGLAAIADDSGIEVPALRGEPGIYSSRYAGENASDEANMDKLINNISSLPETKREARFVCVMVYLRHPYDPVPIIGQGIWQGHLVTEPRGEYGFGYDPIFFIPEHQCTSAELEPAVKNKLSHRSQALRELVSEIYID